jgi:hypothetical protein
MLPGHHSNIIHQREKVNIIFTLCGEEFENEKIFEFVDDSSR